MISALRPAEDAFLKSMKGPAKRAHDQLSALAIDIMDRAITGKFAEPNDIQTFPFFLSHDEREFHIHLEENEGRLTNGTFVSRKRVSLQ